MNLKKHLITAVSTFAIVLGLVVPAGVAQPVPLPPDDTATGVVQVVDAGTFSVSICNVTGDVDFGTVGVATNASNQSEAQLFICYEDTALHRPGFLTQLYADEWTSGNIPVVLPQTTIPADNLIPFLVWGPISEQLTPYWYTGGYIYGDGIGVANPVLVGMTPASTGWDSGALDTPQTVGHGDEGRGTTFTTAEVDLRLTVPANTSPGTYYTTITVDVVPREP